MPPKDFVEARKSNTVTIVDDKPYYPNLEVKVDGSVDGEDGEIGAADSLISVALQLIFHGSTPPANLEEKLTVKKVTGGITNALYCISGFGADADALNLGFDSILMRVFGAEGMIDRDVETSTFASLAEYGVAPPYHGRFANGRIEGWLVDCSPLSIMDLQSQSITNHIAVEMAKLHCGFQVPEELREWHNEKEPGLWSQLFSWMDQAKSIKEYKSPGDDARALRLIHLDKIEKELHRLKDDVVPVDANVSFCHNDLLAANIMKHGKTGEIKLIDFEYGGVNYAAFDIANHFNEHAGGTDKADGVPDYSLFPDEDRQLEFITTYVKKSRSLRMGDANGNGHASPNDSEAEAEEIKTVVKEVKAFVLANHLYWGLWAVNQSAVEGTDEFDYLAYAFNRFQRYFEDVSDFENA